MPHDGTTASPGGGAQPLHLATDAMVSDALAHWDGLRAGRIVPARVDLDPAALVDLLGHAAILERPRPGTIRIRLAGGRIAALMGMEVRGMPFRALFDLSDRSRLMHEADTAFDTPALLLANISAEGAEGAAQPATQMAMMPLSDSAGAISRAMVILGEGACRTPAAIPCRWRIAEITRIPLRAGEPLVPPVRPGGPTARRTPAATPRFRVIKGGRA